MADQLSCPHTNRIRSRGWDHGFHQYLCQDCDAVIDAPDEEKNQQLQKELLYSINRLLAQLQDELRTELPSGLTLHRKTLQIIRLQSYRNSAYDENGNWR